MQDRETGTEDEQVRAAQQGEAGAFEALVERHYVRVYQLACRLLGGREDAEDVVQETFLRCYRALPRFRSDRPLSPWLLRIAVNCVRDRQRQRRREGPRVPLPDGAGPPAPGREGEDPEAAWLQAEESVPLRQALASLPPTERALLLLHHVEGWPVADLAQAFRLPVTVVKNRLFRTRKKLRQIMEVLTDEASPPSGR